MLDPQLHNKLNLAYAKIGDIGYELALNIRKGKDYIQTQKDKWDRGIKMWQILKLLLRHVDVSTTPPTLVRITPKQVNRLLNCLEKLGNLDALPAVPSLTGVKKVTIINKGAAGADGRDGADGSNAYIEVLPEEGETEVSIREEIIGLNKRYFVSVDKYEAPQIAVEITAPKVYMIGTTVETKNLSVITTKGNKPITGISIITPSSYNADFQALLNFTTINGEAQPVINTLPLSDLSEDLDFLIRVTDGITDVDVEDSIKFYYPFLHGASPGTSIDYFTTLTKTVTGKGNVSFLFNDTDKYFWIGYRSSYGECLIRDEHGHDVTSAFTTFTANVTATGLDNNWTENYRFYRTTLTTDIVLANFSIEFP